MAHQHVENQHLLSEAVQAEENVVFDGNVAVSLEKVIAYVDIKP